MAARLERDVQVRAASFFTGLGERVDLGMRAPELLVPTFTHDVVIADDHATHERIRFDVSTPCLS